MDELEQAIKGFLISPLKVIFAEYFQFLDLV